MKTENAPTTAPLDPIVRRCDGCYWWRQWTKNNYSRDEQMGTCHRFPPVIPSGSKENACGEYEGRQPSTFANDFCGEFD